MLGVLVVAACTVAGTGWLYLLHGIDPLDVGPDVSGALPLQQLAQADAQPLLRMAVAWVPAGVVAGLGMRAVGVGGRGLRAALAGTVAYAVLVVAGTVSDTVAVSGVLGDHVGDQFGRAGTLVATACMVIGSLLVGRADERRAEAAPAPGPAASGR